MKGILFLLGLLLIISSALGRKVTPVKASVCTDDEIYCNDVCIRGSLRCDGRFNCPDGLDEEGCTEIKDGDPED